MEHDDIIEMFSEGNKTYIDQAGWNILKTAIDISEKVSYGWDLGSDDYTVTTIIKCSDEEFELIRARFSKMSNPCKDVTPQ